jgi:hypothetical protein
MRINSRLAKIRAAGEPVTLQELNVYYASVPDAKNAAIVYGRAFAILDKSSSHGFLEHRDELPSSTNALPEDLRQKMEKAVEENQNALEVLHKAAALPACRYPIDYTPGWDALLPHLTKLPLCAKLEMCNGVLKEQKGDVDAAIASVAMISKYATSVDSEPDLISVLVKHWLNLEAFDLSRWILNHRRLSQAQLKLFQKNFDESESDNWVTRASIGERCMVLPMFGYSTPEFLDVISPDGYNNLDRAGIHLLRFSGGLKKDEIMFLDFLEQARGAARLPFPERLDRIEELRSEIRREASSHALFVTGEILPGFINGLDKDAVYVARMRLMQTALAIEQFRNSRGCRPESVEQICPDYLKTALLDPFRGQPLHYRKTDAGYLLYSIGPDGMDDKGLIPLPLNLRSKNVKGDIVLSIDR